MAAVALKNQLNCHIASMFAAGLVDEQFRELLTADEDGTDPEFVADIVDLFVDESKKTIDEIAGLLEHPVVDFNKVHNLVHKLEGCSGSVGAIKMKLMCEQCRQFRDAKSRDGSTWYLWALGIIRNEFTDISNKFHTMLQLEQKIAACS